MVCYDPGDDEPLLTLYPRSISHASSATLENTLETQQLRDVPAVSGRFQPDLVAAFVHLNQLILTRSPIETDQLLSPISSACG
jgi:hypothetical protein